VIDIELWKFLTVLGSAAVLMFGAGLVLGRWGLPSRRVVEERYGIEVTDVEGYDDATGPEHDYASRSYATVPASGDQRAALGLRHDQELRADRGGQPGDPLAAFVPDLHRLLPVSEVPARAVTQVYSPLTPYADWREQTAAELAPAHLDELAERIDLPGPDASTLVAARASHSRAGELDWPTDTRLPAILTLGQAGDGSDKTFARASLAQWDFMVRFRDERDELDRLLAAGRAA
jgi:hypothetical protein